MRLKTGHQPDAMGDIRQHIARSEEKRRALRFEYSIAALSSGAVATLGNEEFVADLADALARDLLDVERVQSILGTVVEATVSPDTAIRERALTVLALATPRVLLGQQHEAIILLGRGLCRWLEHQEELLPGCAVAIKRLEELAVWLLRQSLWQDVQPIVALLAGIHRGEGRKGAAMKSLAARSLANLASEERIERLGDCCLGKDGSEEIPCFKVLKSLARPAVPLLLKRCFASPEQETRRGLLRLARSVAEDEFPGFVEECLSPQVPATVLRDIFSIAAEHCGEELYPALRQYFAHHDSVIQQELVRLVVKLGGPAMTDRLLTALELVHDGLKVAVIRLLAEHAAGDQQVLAALAGLVQREKDSPSASRQKLLRAVVVALRDFPGRVAFELLLDLRRECEGTPDWERLGLQLERTLKVLTPRLRHDRRGRDAAGEVEFDADPLARQLACSRVAEIEKEVRKLLHKGDSRAAGRFLLQQARAVAEKSDFIAAEMLRDRMLEVDPMAMEQVVELGEWLEKQKRVSVEPLHAQTWHELGGMMPPAALKSLHRVLRRETYGRDEEIVLSGEADESLYFLSSGQLGLTCRSGTEERFLKRVKPGAVLGGSQFFAASVWTYSLRAISDVQVHVLNRPGFQSVAGRFPELEPILQQYCMGHEGRIGELLTSSGEDRRGFPRYPATLLVMNSLQDPYGAGESRAFQGELIDIARGGLAFTVRISSKEHARLMAGREIVSTIQADGEALVRCRGMVIGVRQQDPATGSYSIHVRLAGTIADYELDRILSLVQK